VPRLLSRLIVPVRERTDESLLGVQLRAALLVAVSPLVFSLLAQQPDRSLAVSSLGA
jgi:hypothetical protein